MGRSRFILVALQFLETSFATWPLCTDCYTTGTTENMPRIAKIQYEAILVNNEPDHATIACVESKVVSVECILQLQVQFLNQTLECCEHISTRFLILTMDD